jgi:DNA-binding transcriptional MerR regulator
VSLRSLRYYEEKGLLSPVRQENGYREYGEADIEKIGLIRLYFSLGLSVKEITDFFSCAFHDGTRLPCLPNAIEVGEKKLAGIRRQLDILRRAETQLEEYIARWRGQLEYAALEKENGGE